ncbi:MAG: insulinase family protein [Bdellovibrionales bacterium]|nr:insulinase family protein [Bdellovibrionales bacterium]
MSRVVVFDQPPVFKKTELSNGIRVVTEHHSNSRATAVGFFIDRGSRDEEAPLSGAAHFLEHLVFKGTKTRSAFQIALELEALGGELNAFTSREHTCFHATTLREHVETSVAVLSDIIQNATLNLPDFILEREVVLQEIDTSADSFEEYVFDQYYEKAFPNQSLGRSILGTPESMAELQREDLEKFYKDHYGGKNLIISVAGHVDHDAIVVQLEKALANSQCANEGLYRPKPNVARFTDFLPRPSEQIHAVLGFESVGFKDPHRFDSYIANAVLAGGMTSRLYQKVREESGLVYSIYSYLHSFTDSGLLLLYFATSEKNLGAAMDKVRQELDEIKKRGISKPDLEMFKTQVKGQILMASDDIENRMNSLGVNEMVFGTYRPVESVIDEIDRISTDSFQCYLDTYLLPENMSGLFLGQDSAVIADAMKDFKC